MPNNDWLVSWGQRSREEHKEVIRGTVLLPAKNDG